jgi:hypothetical protein
MVIQSLQEGLHGHERARSRYIHGLIVTKKVRNVCVRALICFSFVLNQHVLHSKLQHFTVNCDLLVQFSFEICFETMV